MSAALLTARLLKHAKPIDLPDLEPLKLPLSYDFASVLYVAGAWTSGICHLGLFEIGSLVVRKEEKNGWELTSSECREAGKVRWNNWHFRGGVEDSLIDDIVCLLSEKRNSLHLLGRSHQRSHHRLSGA